MTTHRTLRAKCGALKEGHCQALCPPCASRKVPIERAHQRAGSSSPACRPALPHHIAAHRYSSSSAAASASQRSALEQTREMRGRAARCAKLRDAAPVVGRKSRAALAPPSHVHVPRLSRTPRLFVRATVLWLILSLISGEMRGGEHSVGSNRWRSVSLLRADRSYLLPHTLVARIVSQHTLSIF
jgi:hypothetical protein